MAISAATAHIFTNKAIAITSEQEVAREVDLTERAILNSTGRGEFYTLHNARIIGNPLDNPSQLEVLSDKQLVYKTVFVDRGYMVSTDGRTGYWKISWDDRFTNSRIKVYSIRTSVIPGAISELTIGELYDAFRDSVPSITLSINIVAALEEPYEYTIIADQQDEDRNYSDDFLAVLIASGLGYTTINTKVLQIS